MEWIDTMKFLDWINAIQYKREKNVTIVYVERRPVRRLILVQIKFMNLEMLNMQMCAVLFQPRVSAERSISLRPMINNLARRLLR